MAYNPAHPFVANDPLAYFSALKVPNVCTQRPALQTPANQALELMYGYYRAD
jgi:hypothetical protein